MAMCEVSGCWGHGDHRVEGHRFAFPEVFRLCARHAREFAKVDTCTECSRRAVAFRRCVKHQDRPIRLQLRRRQKAPPPPPPPKIAKKSRTRKMPPPPPPPRRR